MASMGMSARSRSGRRGVALSTVLLCMVVLTLILFTAVSASLSHLRFVHSAAAAEHARNLADAALSRALARLDETDFQFGNPDGSIADRRVVVTLPDLPDSSGVVTFNRSESGFSDGYSTWNINSDNGVTGAGNHQVPARTVHLVARGKVGDVERWMECVYYRPPFPDGMVSTGPIDAKSVQLSAIRSAQGYAGGDPAAIAQENQLPANVFSNALVGQSGAPAVLLSGQSRISGSVGAKGSVSVVAPSLVQGEVLPGSEERSIPDLRLEEKFALVEESSGLVTSTGGDLVLEPNWFSRSEGTLTINGDLDLNGTALLVKNGDLIVRGGIKGRGVILSEGKVEIHDGRTNLDTSELVAIGCKGDFILRADAPESNYFRGLIYSESAIDAKDITVVGGMVSNGKNGGTGSIKLDNVRFVHDPTSLDIVVFPIVKARRWNENRKRYEYAAFWVSIQPGSDPNIAGATESGWIVDAGTCIQTQGTPKYSQTDGDGSVSSYENFTDPFLIGKTVKEWETSNPTTYSATVLPPRWHALRPGESTTEQQIRIVKSLVGKDSGEAAPVVEWLDQRSGLSGGEMDSWDTNIWHQTWEESSQWNPPPEPDKPLPNGSFATNSYRSALDAADPSVTLRFNLNNLLAELSGKKARVALWRPFR